MIEQEKITDKHIWEEFITSSGLPTSFFQSWNWGEFEKERGSKIHRLGFYDAGDLIGIGLAIETDAKRGRYLHFRNGPVINWKDDFSAHEIMGHIYKYGKKEGVDFIRISPLVEPGAIGQFVIKGSNYTESQMHDVDAEITWMLDLTQPLGKIQENMRKNTRYYIRKAERDGVEITSTTDVKYLNDFWKIYQDTVKRQKWTAYSFDYIRTEFERFSRDNQAKLYLAKYKGAFIAGAIFIYHNNQAYYHHSGSLTKYRKLSAPYLLQWESIKDAKKRGLKLYNFFGIARDDNPNHPWHGLTFFKKGFGGCEQRWIHAKDLPLKFRYWLTNFYERLERKKRGY
ncbi:MAG: lipid II:glycine glycyltransferase FemX [Candidatus Dojkabacteria bacterium]